MSSDWRQWPGLARAEGGRLTVQRAAFGKADRARTDYRWLAASAGWAPGEERLERRLALGGEDRSVRCPLWLHEGGQWLAVMCIPSRARDFDGRLTPLEKHMLRCVAVPEVTPALAAFALFEEVARLSSDRWFDSYDQPQWQRADYQLALDENAVPPLEARLDDLEPRFEEGLTLLQSATTKGDLAQFYAQVLTAGAPPALLRLTSEMPLEPFSLAALLLPLEPTTYSFAGGIPSSIFPTENEIQNWTGLVVQAHVQRVPARASVAGEALRRGEEIAAALWDRDPRLLAPIPTATAVATSRAPVAPPIQAATPVAAAAPVRVSPRAVEPLDDASTSRERTAKILQERLAPMRLEEARKEFLSFVRGRRYDMRPRELPDTQKRSHNDFAVWEDVVLEFRTKVLDVLDALERRPVPDDRFERYALESMRDELRVKAQIGRAWLIALIPRMALLDVIGRPGESDDEGPLSFAVHFHPETWRACCDFPLDLIRDLIRRTRRGAEMTRLVDQWARDAGVTP
jgi:hypothetical protein